MRKKSIYIVILMLLLFIVTSCGTSPEKKGNPLDPDKPITVTLWHYYSGYNKENFDDIVRNFNETTGMEKGIAVEAMSQGDVQQLADAVYNSANKGLGAKQMPDIFAAYADNALRVNQVMPIVTLDTYFSEEELSKYKEEFLEEGNFLEDEKYRIVPVAKSTEILYVNKTLWDEFASETGADIEKLSHWEGIAETAKSYYNHTGKSFFGIDSNANFMILGSVQNGQKLFTYDSNNQRVTLNFTREYAKKIWDYIYKPYINGYYLKQGRFSSDDAKTGTVIAYTGSTAGAAYFPKEVIYNEKEKLEIQPMTFPYPYFKDGEPYAVQQGAGMCIAKSDYAHEYAAAEFLKWFTQPEKNLKFAILTGYLPVENQALKEEKLLDYLKEQDLEIPSIVSSIKTSIRMFDTHTLYINKPFIGSYDMRNLMENHLINKIKRDLKLIEEKVEKEGYRKQNIVENLSSESEFEKWYENIKNEANKIVN